MVVGFHGVGMLPGPTARPTRAQAAALLSEHDAQTTRQCPANSPLPGGQRLLSAMQTPPRQAWELVQSCPQVPQSEGFDWRSTQDPPQLVVPAPQDTWQVPAEQTVPAAQTRPQRPQLLLSDCRSRQVPLHAV